MSLLYFRFQECHEYIAFLSRIISSTFASTSYFFSLVSPHVPFNTHQYILILLLLP